MNFIFKQEIIDYDYIYSRKGSTVLFLHGWGGNKKSFLSTINLLKPNYNILTITIPTTDKTNEVWDMYDYSELIIRILQIHGLDKIYVVCHSFGFRIACLIKDKIHIDKIIVTGGAGPKKSNVFKRISTQNNRILLSQKRFAYLYKNISSKDYQSLDQINKQTFKNIVNLNLLHALPNNHDMLIFWGKKDRDTKPWIAKYLSKTNTAKTIYTNSDHFAYLKENAKFNNEVLKFLK
ncbi:MAG: alpha/beta hydrolase [Clostridiales bacterium]|nr:alpha/beta hydrolase [Clostridiales bacterium]